MDKKTIEIRTAVATKWSSLAEIVAKLISPIVNMVLARLLTPEAFGVVATVTMVTSFADIFTDAGFQKYLIQHDFNSEEELNQSTNVAFWTNLGISVFLYIVICCFNRQIAKLVGNDGLGHVIIVAAISILLTSFSSIQSARYKRDFDFKSLFFVRIITSTIPLVITVPLAFVFHSYWALIIGTLLNNFANTILLTIKSGWKPKFFFKWVLLREMFSYSWWILLESIAVWFTSYIGTFIVGNFLNDYYLGLYKTSMSTVNQIIALITAATSMPLFSALSRLKDDREGLIETYCRYMQAISMFVMPIGVGIWLYRGFITDLLLGSQWTESTDFIGLWGLTSSVCLILGTYCNGLFNAVGKTKLSFWAQVLHLIAIIPTLVITAQMGFQTLFIWRSLIRLELILVELIFLKVFIKFPLTKLLKAFIPATISTVIMWVVILPISKIFDSLVWDIVTITFCILVYFISLRLLNKRALENMLKTFGIDFGANKIRKVI